MVPFETRVEVPEPVGDDCRLWVEELELKGTAGGALKVAWKAAVGEAGAAMVGWSARYFMRS